MSDDVYRSPPIDTTVAAFNEEEHQLRKCLATGRTVTANIRGMVRHIIEDGLDPTEVVILVVDTDDKLGRLIVPRAVVADHVIACTLITREQARKFPLTAGTRWRLENVPQHPVLIVAHGLLAVFPWKDAVQA